MRECFSWSVLRRLQLLRILSKIFGRPRGILLSSEPALSPFHVAYLGLLSRRSGDSGDHLVVQEDAVMMQRSFVSIFKHIDSLLGKESSESTRIVVHRHSIVKR